MRALVRAHRNDGDPVARVDRLTPGHGKFRAERHGRRRRDGLLGFDDFDRGRGQRLAALVEHVAHLVEARLGGRAQRDAVVVAYTPAGQMSAFIRADRNDGHPVARMNRLAPGHGELRAEGHGRRGGDGLRGRFRFYNGLRFGFRLDNGLAFDGRLHLRHGGAQLVRILGWHKNPAGVLGDAGKLLVLLARKIEADHMRCKGHPLPFELRGQRARISLAGLHPIRHQNHRCRIIPVREEFSGLFNRGGQRRAPSRGDRVDGPKESIPVDRAGLHHQLDIRAIALPAMPVGQQTQIGRLRPGFDKTGHHVAGDLDLGRALDLSPHRVRSVIDDHHIVRCGSCYRCESEQSKG